VKEMFDYMSLAARYGLDLKYAFTYEAVYADGNLLT